MKLQEIIEECLNRKLDFRLRWLDLGPEVTIEINLKDIDFSQKADIINVFKYETNPYLMDESLTFSADYEGSWQKVGTSFSNTK